MVIALVGLIFILLLVFVLIIRGQSKKYAKKADSGEQPGTCLPPFWKGWGTGGLSLPWKCICSDRWGSLAPTQSPSPHLVSTSRRKSRGVPARGQRGGPLIYRDGMSDRMSISPLALAQGAVPSLAPWATAR